MDWYILIIEGIHKQRVTHEIQKYAWQCFGERRKLRAEWQLLAHGTYPLVQSSNPPWIAIVSVGSVTTTTEFHWYPLSGNGTFDWNTDSEETDGCQMQEESETVRITSGWTEAMASTIHHLADQLPCPGSFLLDIFMCNSILSLDPNVHIDLMGSLLRLIIWHGAVLMVPHAGEERYFDVWQQCLKGRLQRQWGAVSKSDVLLWRGNITVGCPQLGVTPVFPDYQLVAKRPEREYDWHIRLDEVPAATDHKLYLVMDTCLQLLDKCSIRTVPQALVSSCQLRLELSSDNPSDKQLSFLQYCTSTHNECLVFRLTYCQISAPEVSQIRPDLNTEAWKRAILDGHIQSIRPMFTYQSKRLMLLCTSMENFSSRQAKMYLLQEPWHLFPNLHLGAFWHTDEEPRHHPEQRTESGFLNSDFHAMHIVTHSDPRKVGQAISEAQTALLYHCIDEANTRIKPRLVRMMSDVFQKILEFEHCKPLIDATTLPAESLGTSVGLSDRLSTSVSQTDPLDWPERRWLLVQEVERQQLQQESVLDLLAGLAPPPANSLVITVGIKDITNYFLPSGEARKMSQAVLKTRKQCSFKPSISLHQLQHMAWPDIKHSQYHDVYYNRNHQSEVQQSCCNLLQERLVFQETSSTCNRRHQVRSDSSITFTQPSAMGKEPVCAKRFDVAQNTNHNAGIRSPRTRCIRTQLHKVRGRTSTRHKSPVKGPQCSQLKKGLRDTTLGNSLSKRHALKLWSVVAETLRKNGIERKNSSFGVCVKRLFAVSAAFAKDIVGNGDTTAKLRRIAESHVKQVIDFERENDRM